MCVGFRKNDSKSGETRQATYTYDKLGRVTQRTVNAGRATVPTSFTYVSGPYGTGSTTPLVASMTQLTRTLEYTYDNAGNITSVSEGGKKVRYTYDTLGQLIRVDDPNDLTTSLAGTTWVFTYDFGGNILTKTGYAYTTGTVGAIQRSYTYVYGDANWKDKLTAINGDVITSDAIGNPLNDGTWTYQWAKGRQLQSMSKPGVSVSYTYNEDGLRVGKNVNGTATNYVLHGKNVVHLTRGSDTLHFYYGADGHPTVVEYNGVSYGYTYNLQGDVISLQDADGWTQVQYAYDAWGQPIGKTGAMADTLGTLNPFRYRGYLYDEETGLYYLRSRYYNPSWGRFISIDSALGKPMQILENNLYAYCCNKVVTKADSDGTDAYWLTDSGNVWGLGHTSLLLEDNEGDWYYFYWGPIRGGVPLRTQVQVKVTKVPVTFQENGMIDLKALNDKLQEGPNPIYEGFYNIATLFTGNYNPSVQYAKRLKSTYENKYLKWFPAYGVAFSNCMQASAYVMQQSTPITKNFGLWMCFQLYACDMVPAYVGWIHQICRFPRVELTNDQKPMLVY